MEDGEAGGGLSSGIVSALVYVRALQFSVCP
jgi:hypothetical protein